MPLIKVQTSLTGVETVTGDQLLQQLSASLATHTGKPEAYVMTALEAGARMTFGGTFEPVCYVEVKNVGSLTARQTTAMSQDFCTQINGVLGVPMDRIYIEFTDAKGAMWGWNGTTFG